MNGCAFPFHHPATVTVWLLIAIAAGWVYGGRMAGRVDRDPRKYRERWGYAPRTSLVAVTIVLLLSLVPLVGQSVFSASFCDDLFWGWAWLLISPWVVVGLARAWMPMARLARAERASPSRRGK